MIFFQEILGCGYLGLIKIIDTLALFCFSFLFFSFLFSFFFFFEGLLE